MGRRIVRVPLGFDAPLNKVWQGYLMPESLRLPTCPECNGYTRDATYRWVEAIATRLLMLGEDGVAQERGRPLHPYLTALDGCFTGRPVPVSAVELSTGLASRGPGFLGHDAIDRWSATKKIIEAAGLDPDTWAVCRNCGGKGDTATDEDRAAYEAWKLTELPAGDGWQLWETVSEGSPISPVFATADELASWMSDPARGRDWVPGDVAAKFIADGWAPSFVGTGGDLMSGVEFMGTRGGDA